MERLYPNPKDPEKKPDKTGETDTPKNKRKRTTRIPLRNTKQTAEQAVKQEQSPKSPGFFETKKPEQSAELKAKTSEEEPQRDSQDSAVESSQAVDDKSEKASSDELILPEVENTAEATSHEAEPKRQPVFFGELKIEHEEPTDQKDAAPENATPEQPVQAEASAGESQPAAENLDTQTEAEAVESSEAQAEANAETIPSDPSVNEAEPVVEAQEESPEPPRVAPPLIFELPSENLSPAGQPEVQPQQPQFTPHMVESGTMFDPSILRHREASPKPFAEPMVSERVANNRAYRAEKRGLSRGVVSGGVAGWLLGRRGKRKIERKAAVTIGEKDEAIRRLAAERDAQRNLSERRLNILQRTQEEFKSLMKKNWDTQILNQDKQPDPFMPHTFENVQAAPEPVPESAKPVFETSADDPVKKEKLESKEPPVERPEDQQITEETYLAPVGHRVELSAWHRIEIDKATNRTAEQPHVAYGEAFKREQSQEKLARDAAKAQTAAQVGVALLQGGGSSQANAGAASDDKKDSAKQSAPANPFKFITDNTGFIKQEIIRQTTSPFIWLVSLSIVVLLFVSGILR